MTEGLRTAVDDDADLVANVRPRDWVNPRPRDRYTLVILGGGPAGVQAAIGAAALGANVALVEQHRLGGESLNHASVPSKTFIRTGRLYAEMRSAELFGAVPPPVCEADIDRVLERARYVRARIGLKHSARWLRSLGVDVYFGQARFEGRDSVRVDDVVLRFAKALVATGSVPAGADAIEGLEAAGYVQPSTVFHQRTIARRSIIIGGGREACEGAQTLARFGRSVVIAMDEPYFLPGEERDAAQMVSDALARDGVEIHLNTRVTRVRVDGERKLVELDNGGELSTVAVDQIFVALGRRPNVADLDLARAGIAFDAERGIHVDDFLRTSNPRVYAAGDVCLQPRFTSIAYASARIAVFNALLWKGRRFSKLTIPWCTYTDPEIAHVGLYVRDARERGIPIRTVTVAMHDVDRAIADGEETGFVKMHVHDGSGRILGATIVARHAGEMINEISLAISLRMKLSKLADVLRAYPTQAEAVRMAADRFRASRLTRTRRTLLRWWITRRG